MSLTSTMDTGPGTVLFDLDGTLADTAPDIAAALDEVLAAQGHPPAGLDAARGWIGNGVERLLERALLDATARRPKADEVARAVRAFLGSYSTRLVARSCCYPGMIDLLGALSGCGIRVGCVTNKPEAEARAVLEGLGIAPLFGCVVGGDTTPEKKPSPLPVQRALAVLGAARESTILVGDSDNDLRAATAAGVRSIWVTWGYQAPPQAPADNFRIAESVARLKEFLIPPVVAPADRVRPDVNRNHGIS
ncbi:MAG: phosphoglycolate phosphatase [Pseudomonadota bacterium]|nr:phosphoglycolate phosphatase [Pseudomonadota bacterium]